MKEPSAKDPPVSAVAVASPEEASKEELRFSRRLPRSPKTSEVVARHILERIIASGHEEGSTLPPESEMLREYGIGRATLREALRLLEVQGLLIVKSGPGGGPVIQNVSARDLGRTLKMHLQLAGASYEQLVQARLILDPIMAALAAEHHDPQGLENLQIAMKLHDRDIDDDDIWQEATRDFHYAVSGMSGNPVLDIVVRALKEILDEKVKLTVSPPEMRPKVKAAHERVASAIIGGRVREAEYEMRNHMTEYANQVRETRPGTLEDPIEWI